MTYDDPSASGPLGTGSLHFAFLYMVNISSQVESERHHAIACAKVALVISSLVHSGPRIKSYRIQLFSSIDRLNIHPCNPPYRGTNP